MHAFFKEFSFFHSFTALYLSSNSVPHKQGEGAAKQKADRREQREGGVENWQKYADILYRRAWFEIILQGTQNIVSNF